MNTNHVYTFSWHPWYPCVYVQVWKSFHLPVVTLSSAVHVARQHGAYRDLLDLPRVRDDLLHHLHGLPSAALRLLRLPLRLGLDYLHLLAFSHLHGHGRALQRRVMRADGALAQSQ